MERNAWANAQFSRKEIIELDPVSAYITDVLEEIVYNIVGVNVVPNDLHTK